MVIQSMDSRISNEHNGTSENAEYVLRETDEVAISDAPRENFSVCPEPISYSNQWGTSELYTDYKS